MDKLDELPLESEELLPSLDELLTWLELDGGLSLLRLELLPVEPEEPELLLDEGDPEELLDPDEPLLEGGGGGAPLELEDPLEPEPDELDDSDDMMFPFSSLV